MMAHEAEKNLFSSRQCTISQVHETMAKFNEFGFYLLPHPLISPDLASATTGSLLVSIKCSREKKFGSNKQVIAETEAYFEAKDKFFYRHCLEILERRWKCFITYHTKGDYIGEEK